MLESVNRPGITPGPQRPRERSTIMGEAALAYWLEEYINPSAAPREDAFAEESRLAIGDSDEDWKFGSD